MQMSGLSRCLCEPSPSLEGYSWASAERCAIPLIIARPRLFWAREKSSGDIDGRGRKLEHHHEYTDGRSRDDAEREERGWRADRHPDRRRQFRRDFRRHGQWRRPFLEGFDYEPDVADARIHRQGLRRQHFRRNGHRPDGQLSVHGNTGVRRLRASSLRKQGPIRCGDCYEITTWSKAFTQDRDDVVRGTLPPSRNANESGEGPTGLSRLIAALPSAWVLMGP